MSLTNGASFGPPPLYPAGARFPVTATEVSVHILEAMIALIRAGLFWLPLIGLAMPSVVQADEPFGGMAMHGTPALRADFDHLPYANPMAPKGGTVRLCFLGTFDSLNPFNLKAGSTAQGLINFVFEPLMTRSLNEPFSLYGLVADRLKTDEARSFALFRLDPRARFSDGSPITADDVLFTFDLLRRKGRPQQRSAFNLVKAAEALDPHSVRFDLSGSTDRELPMFLALMPVLSKAATDAARFDETTLAPPVASGPYRVVSVEAGHRVVLERNTAYWGRDLPIRRGLFNFDRATLDYYRDPNSLFEAFKAGLCDYWIETDPTRWLTGYDIPAVRDGQIVKEAVPLHLPRGLDGFAFNTRRSLFSDVRVREALSLLFDFEWIDHNLYGDLYRRTASFFADSDLASTGRPATPAERTLLAPFPGAVRADILEGTWAPPTSDGSGRDRDLARQAIAQLANAGYRISGTHMMTPDGLRFDFDLMVADRRQERLALAFAESLARIGIAAHVRLVDEVQYQRRRQSFDFDMMLGSWPASPSPGAEQRSRWGSASAKQEASFNLPGVVSPAVDSAISAILSARSDQDFIAAVRTLDRLLLSGFYVIPLFHSGEQWIAYWSSLGRPKQVPMFGLNNLTPLELWWRKLP